MQENLSYVLKIRKLWLILGWFWLLIIVTLSLISIPKIAELSIQHVDKIEHSISYFVLMFLFAQCYTAKATRLGYALLFVLLGVSLEFLQGYTATRQFEYADMIANTSGVILGLILSDSFLNKFIRYLDSTLLRTFF